MELVLTLISGLALILNLTEHKSISFDTLDAWITMASQFWLGDHFGGVMSQKLRPDFWVIYLTFEVTGCPETLNLGPIAVSHKSRHACFFRSTLAQLGGNGEGSPFYSAK